LQPVKGIGGQRRQRIILIRDATFHDSPRHAARAQLLAKRLLLVRVISLHSKRILTIGF
jgi:hypothetical protein